MALTTTRAIGEIGIHGGNIAYLREVLSTGVDLGTPDTNHSIGELESTDITDNTDSVENYNEAGGRNAILDDKRKVSVKFICQQSSLAFMGLVKEVRGKFYRLYYQGPVRNGKITEWLFAICRVTPKLELAYKSGEVTKVPVEIECLENAALVAVLNTALPTEKITAGAMDVAAKEYYFTVETTAP